MSYLVDRWSPAVFVFFLFVKILQFFKNNLILPREDGWRRATRAYFRTEQAKFCLASFRLDLWSDNKNEDIYGLEQSKKHFSERYLEFCKQEHIFQWQLDWKKTSIRREEKKQADMVCANFKRDGMLESIELYLDPDDNKFTINNQLRALLNEQFIYAYNVTREADDKIRPWKLKKKIQKLLLNLNLNENKSIPVMSENAL